MKVKYTKEVLEPIVKSNKSLAGVLRNLNLKQSGGNHRTIKKYINCFKIDTSHFTGQLWSKGQTMLTNDSLMKSSLKRTINKDDDVFSDSSFVSGSCLRRRFLKTVEDKKCSICGLYDWLKKPITLHVDHINGNNIDNRIENLRLLCPNCHQQTSTWGAKNTAVVKLPDTIRLDRISRNRVGVEVPPAVPKYCLCGKKNHKKINFL